MLRNPKKVEVKRFKVNSGLRTAFTWVLVYSSVINPKTGKCELNTFVKPLFLSSKMLKIKDFLPFYELKLSVTKFCLLVMHTM
jgi:hypothetical protein